MRHFLLCITFCLSAMLNAASFRLGCNSDKALLGMTLRFSYDIAEAENAKVVDLMVMEPDVDSYRHLGAVDYFTPQSVGVYHFEAIMSCDEADEVHSNIVMVEISQTDEINDDHFIVRFKGNRHVWTRPFVKVPNGFYLMSASGTEGESVFWECDIPAAAGQPIKFSMLQDGYTGDYYSGTIETLPSTLTEPGTYCFTAANLNGKANINRDNTYAYTTTETNYDTANGDNTGRQAGKLFEIVCDDADHHIYYSSLEGKSGDELRQAIMDLTNARKRVTSYQNLREAYAITDYREYGTIWDMYSNKAGTYLYPEGVSGGESETKAAYNREHSMVKSYWGHENNACIPAFSDIVHVVPTNGYVNTCRLTYPYGEVGQVTQAFGNGTKKGYSGFGSYTDVVFEPIDEYKGDFARIYFYMLTCYGNLDYTHNDHGKVTFYFDGTRSQFTNYGQSLMMKWSRQDNVSEKERSRNDGIQAVQGNRNPFVDLPNLAEYLWGKNVNVPYSYDDSLIPTSVQSADSQQSIRAWQYGGTIFIDFCGSSAKIEILSLLGQVIYSANVYGAQTITCPAGQTMHIVRATYGDGKNIVIKVK